MEELKNLTIEQLIQLVQQWRDMLNSLKKRIRSVHYDGKERR